MSNPRLTSRPVSPRQSRFLRNLALERGESFAYPATFEEADREIKRLLGRKRQPRDERRREVRAVQDAMSTGRGDAASIRDSEISGWGSSAAWS